MQSLTQAILKLSSSAKGGDPQTVKTSLDELLKMLEPLRKTHQDAEVLVGELLVWKQKLDVILKEPIGRQGMSKHLAHWAEKLSV